MTEPRPGMLVGPRQAQVLKELLKDGASNLEIAKRIYVAEDTVKSHLKTLMRKAGARNRTHLAVMIANKEIEVFVHGSIN